jgi:hypothetical protein
MRMTFTKRDGKYDDLTVEREGRPEGTIRCPKQGIIPHDMVHVAVETILSKRGFLSLLDKAERPGFQVRGGECEEAIERLVECFQAEMWSGEVPVAELLDAYALGCEARSHAPLPISGDEVARIRARLRELTDEWNQVQVGGSVAFEIE